MIKTDFYKLIVLTLCICGAGYAFAKQQSATQEGLDLVVVLSTGCEEVLKVDNIKHEPCCNELFAACKDEQIALVSPSILYGLLKRKRQGQDIISECIDRITNGYAAYLNRDEDFVLLIPTTKSKNLKDIGFNESQFSCIEPGTLMQFSESRWASHLIEIDHFKKLFRQEETDYQPPAKHIYLISHGIDALDEVKNFKWSMPLVASLAVWQFVNFLQMLNTINTQFLHIASCYAAGSNFLNVNRILSGTIEDERCVDASVPLKYPIVVQGTTDSPVSAIIGDGQGCKSFFSVIRQWLENNGDGDMLAQLLSQSLYNCKQVAACNYPVLKMPEYATMASLPVDGVTAVAQDGIVTSVDSNVHHIFFYPVFLRNSTVVLESLNTVPHCISKISGRAAHFLGTICAPALDEHTCISLLENCFLKEVIRDHDGICCYGVSDKAWFIDSLVQEGQTNPIAKGVVIQKGMLKYGTHKAIIAYQDAQGTYHRIKMNLPAVRGSWSDEIITDQEYIKLVTRIFWETRSDQELSSAEQGMTEFLSNLGISMPAIDLHAMVQEDCAQIGNYTLKKEAYLNYVAHVHDRGILHELIELCMQHSNVLDFTDIATILTHLIDMEQQGISLSVAVQLLGKDDTMAKQAAIDALTYMVHVGLYAYASRAVQDVLAIVTAMSVKQTMTGQEVALLESICNFLVQLLHLMVKEEKTYAAELIMSSLINHDQWYMYGLGLKVSIELRKQYPEEFSMPAGNRLQWFAEQLAKQRTVTALAVYFERANLVDQYRQLLSA